MGRHSFTMEFEVTEYDPPHSVRLVCTDNMGTTWDSIYELEPLDQGTRVTLTMQCIPTKFAMRLMWPLMKILTKRGVQEDFGFFTEHLNQVEEPY